MNLRAPQIAIILALLASAAPAIKPREVTLAITIKALDAQGRSVNSLHQSDFALRIDRADTAIQWWRKAEDWFHRCTYTIKFKA
jgi:hypothetical protein